MTRGWILAWAILLIVSLGIGSIATARYFYAQKLISRVWPKNDFDPVRATPPQSPGGILLVGDSRLAEWPLTRLAGLPVQNGAVFGSTSAEMTRRLRKQLEVNRPQIVVMEIGINDLKLIGVRPDLKDALIEQCLANIQQAIDICLQHQVQVFLFPVWEPGPVSPSRWLVWNKSIEESISDINARMRAEMAGHAHVTLVPLHSVFSKPSASQRAALYRDTLHLKSEAYGLIGKELEVFVSEWLKGKQ